MNVFKITAFVLFIAALALAACVSFGHFATAEDQAKWGTYPCMSRFANAPDVCDDDWTDEGAADICPCHPATAVELLFPSDAGVKDGGASDAAK